MKHIAWCGLLLLVMVAGCKKDKEIAPGLEIKGTWKKVESSLNFTTYYHFTADGYLYIMERDGKGWKDISKGLYQFEDGQLITSFPSETPGSSIYSTLYNITQGTDTIILSSNGIAADNTILLKDNLAPKSVADFITPVQVISSFEDTAQVTDITYYNSKLYGIKSSDQLMVYGITEKKLVEVRTMTESYQGIEFDYDGNFWAVGYSYKLKKVDPVTGNILFSSADGDNYLHALTYDGVYWIGASSRDGKLDSYYYPTDDFTGGYSGNYYITDLAYGNSHGYAVQEGAIHRFNQSFFDYDKAYYIEGYRCKSIAYDNNSGNYWVGAEDIANGKYYMLQVQLN